MGYNKNAVLGVWQGFDDNTTISSTDTSSHKDIWIDTMELYFKNHNADWYDVPKDVVGVLVNPITGVPVDKDTDKKEMFFYLKGTEPTLQTVSKDLDEVFKEENIIETEEEQE